MNRESFLISCTRRLRESGEAIILADQSISSLMDVVKSNVYTLICLGQSSSKDMREAIEVLGLDRDQAQIINKLEPGQGIIKLSSRYPFPVLVNFPFVESVFVSEREVDDNNKCDLFVSRLLEKVRHIEKPAENAGNDAVENKLKPAKNEIRPKKPEKEFSDNIRQYLMAVYLYQYKKTKIEISDLAGFSRGTGSRVGKQCEKNNLIKTIEISFGRGKPQYLVLLDKAYEILGVKEKKFFGKGAGIEHVLYQHLIVEHFHDLKPVIELYRGGKHIDVAIENNSFLLAIEVAMTAVHERANIEKDIQKAKADFVIVACKDKKVLGKVQESIVEILFDLLSRVKVVLISELLNMESEELTEVGNGKI